MLNPFLNEKIDVLDMMSILSFYIGLSNYGQNLTQSDLEESLSKAIDDIHTHLEEQDKKIDKILEVINYDKNKITG